ncbi:hypothetical protein PFLUV_G00160810 [Scomber scombrus]|uniref:Fibronectin type-III domain-containing protein n=1 Tax=Scomber scombrus TaxID=13677 RepID=A0AAV1Q6R8_SCOSC
MTEVLTSYDDRDEMVRGASMAAAAPCFNNDLRSCNVYANISSLRLRSWRTVRWMECKQVAAAMVVKLKFEARLRQRGVGEQSGSESLCKGLVSFSYSCAGGKLRSLETYDLRRMQFSFRLSVCLLGFVLVCLFPQPAQGQVSSPRRFRAKVLSPTQLHVSWKEPKGEFESYKVVYITEPGDKQTELPISKQEAKLIIEDFDPSKEYNFKITAVHRGQESKPLRAKHEAVQRSSVEMAQSQRRPDRVAEENNEISEGKKEAIPVKRNQKKKT